MSDDDYGSALTLLGNDAISIDKNGTLYAFDRASGTIVWSDRLGNLDGYGGISSAASDGTTIVVGGGYVHDPTKTRDDPGGLLYGLTRGGKILWKLQTDSAIPGSAAIVPGVAFVTANDGISALAIGSGATLWSYPFGAETYASAAVVPSGVYVADAAGNLYAFGLPASASNAARAAKSGRR
jgi:outer membrane protein assembly factor BamB